MDKKQLMDEGFCKTCQWWPFSESSTQCSKCLEGTNKERPEEACKDCYMWRDGCKFWYFESTAGYSCEREQGPLMEKP